jgi:hypothetical protein
MYYNATEYGYNATAYDGYNTDDYAKTTMAMLMIYQNNTKARATSSGPSSGFVTQLCLAYNTTYNVSVNYTNGLPEFTTKLANNAPFFYLNTTELMGNYDNGSIWRINSAMLVREIFDHYLVGSWIKFPTTEWTIPVTSITNTILAGDTDDANNGRSASIWFVNQDLLTGVPQLLTNLTLSTLAFSPYKTTTNRSASIERLVYHYNPKLLLIPYSVALLLCLVAFTAGVWVLRKTGIRTGKIFSQILITTRNPLLDEILTGNSLSSVDAYTLKQQKLMFGELKHVGEIHSTYKVGAESGRTGHAAFGSEEQLLKLTSRRLS